MMTNSTTIAGNLTHDPEIRYSAEGVAVAHFSIAVSRRRRDAEDGAWTEETSFVDVSCFRELAENLVLSISKGSRVLATGRLTQSHWTDANGAKRSKIELVADEVGASLRWSSLEINSLASRNQDSELNSKEREFTQ